MISINSILHHLNQCLISRFIKAISLWIIIRWLSPNNTIFSENFCELWSNENWAIVRIEFLWNTKSWHDIIIEEFNQFSRVVLFQCCCFLPFHEIVCSGENIHVKLTWFWIYWPNDIQPPLCEWFFYWSGLQRHCRPFHIPW